jgi:hypothetical protein
MTRKSLARSTGLVVSTANVIAVPEAAVEPVVATAAVEKVRAVSPKEAACAPRPRGGKA